MEAGNRAGVSMRFLSVCSGIEAASVAWNPLGWKAVAFSEIEPFPCAVLAHHYPDTPNWGDMTKFQEWPNEPIDLLCGGTPCQSFSVAGLRKGLDDPRGNLMLTFGAIAAKYRPKWLVWENVPGVLSSNGGRDFGTFLGMLGQLGYGFAYRIHNAEYFGVPQRRRRVFVIGCLGDWRSAAAVLFEQESFKGDSSARWGPRTVHPCLTAKGARAFDDRTGYVLEEQGIRTTTPLEHERLMGFPDGYTLLPGKRSADTPRFHALGNSWCVPVVRWIGERINIVESRSDQ
ncbi:DNA cytosine methyltransferase [Alcaligenes nematophilus]|uniref:DNA cytosine methyltransferase n=1 Tax=Alcaligenes nematophilus TaxID=2994643 RepID=UPI00384C937B